MYVSTAPKTELATESYEWMDAWIVWIVWDSNIEWNEITLELIL